MGSRQEAKLDQLWEAQVHRSGMIAARFDYLIRELEKGGSVEPTKITLKRRGEGWLIILEAVVDGRKMVQFRDVGNLVDALPAMQDLILEPRWKESKPFGSLQPPESVLK